MTKLNIKRRCPNHPYNPLPADAKACQVCIGELQAEIDRKTPRSPKLAAKRRKRKTPELPEESPTTSTREDMDEMLRVVNG